MSSLNKKYIVFSLLLIIAFGLGVAAGKSGIFPIQLQRPLPQLPVKNGEPYRPIQFTDQEAGKPQEVDFSRFWEVWKQVEENYASRKNIDPQKLVYGAIAGMVKSLNDPYTVFLEPEEAKQFEEDNQGAFEGIGAEIGIKKNVLTIIAPLENTPAQRAGLLAGDKILKIDDTLTADLTIEQAVRLIRGPKGTEVILTISRGDLAETKEIKITRNVIKVPILKLEFKDDVAYVRLYQFTENSLAEFQKTAGEILTSRARFIVLDVRNNPGGFLDKAVEIAGWFIPRGEIVAIESFADRNPEAFYSPGPGKLSSYKTVVLINEGTASASEILAGAMKENRGVPLIGAKTFGKGSVQQVFDFSDGSSLKVTVAKWLTPQGKSIADEGLEPDVKVEMTSEDLEKNRDPQLDKAIEILKSYQ